MVSLNVNKLNKLIYDIRYQTPVGVTTTGPCSNGCGKPARGSEKCKMCLTRDLSELVGLRLAGEFCAATVKTRDLVAEMNKKVIG